ncbi:telomerase protein component 1-like [Haliotis rubra]|uniref:telomerase protein component 1-like n=1 Tax=Haliotis rubra TaxID=36100 RepID=UPI001EE4EF95|nr:telomerase protein component 1-like [Haliotis rubra]
MGCGSSSGYASLEDIRSHSSTIASKPTNTMQAAPEVISTHTTTQDISRTNSTISTPGSHHTVKDVEYSRPNTEELMKDLNISRDDGTVKWWDVVDDFIVRDTPVIKPHTKRKTWKTVRLFISSTFKDMSSEREALVKGVVPALRQWCTERRIRLMECDLRWGVPKDSDTRETLLACLSEIDRCREQNECPYFLNMLSERYGSVMKPEEVPEDIKLRYSWLPGMSVTALEVFTGAYWERNPNALFMMRQPGFLNGVNDENLRNIYQETDPEKVESLRVLKGKIREKFGDRTHDYSCHVEKTENGKLILGGLKNFSVKVHDHFKECIERQYPADSLQQQMTEVEVSYAEQEDFLLLRSQGLKGRDDILDRISNYINTNIDSTRIMYLAGSAGAGKSSLMATSAGKAIGNDKFKVFFHFVGATPDSTNLYRILSRMFHECMPPNTVPPMDSDEMMRYTGTMFEKSTEYALDQGYEKLIVYIDALNQMDDEGMAHKLGWLPRKLPKGMRLVVSTLEGATLHAMRSHEVQCDEVMVEPLNQDYRTKIISEYLADYNKLLDKEQMQLLVTKEDAGRPLYLAISCEELRVFGDFRNLTSKIHSLPGDLSGVIEIVFNRIIKEYGGDKVLSTLCLIETSRFGLSEAELVELLAAEPLIPSSSSTAVQFTGQKIYMAEWALVYLGLHQFLRPCGGGSR